ncbi:PF06252 family protein [Leptospira weilii str. UI 13098]|uniref:PF06252 family protein n=1 Tax=Leptospira weilii str. UI 13098 TaxID=1088542 RepID=M6QCQ0_9LEPT|nr:PF06252 family protein [Leptospira weilii str. UI 13098]
MSSLSQIWTLKSKAGISEENFRNLVESISGSRSTKNLSNIHLEKIATAIYKLHPELKTKNTANRTPNKYKSISKNDSKLKSIVTPDQNELIKKLVSALILSGNYENFSTDSLPLRMFKKSLNELSRHEAQSVIEALKGMLIRANNRGPLEQKKTELINLLKPLSGLESGIEELIIKAITKLDNDFFRAIARIKDEVLDGREPEFVNIEYKRIFSEKTDKLLQTPAIKEKLKDYILKYDELLSKSKYFKSGVFNQTNASTIAKNLKENGFFKANHTVNFISKEERSEIKTEKQLEEIIENEKKEILNNSDLLKIFNELDKQIIANAELREFRDYLQSHIEILPELSDLEAFKEKLWISYFKSHKDAYRALIECMEREKWNDIR